MKIYNVIFQDRNSGIAAKPFLSKEKAIECARESAKNVSKSPMYLKETQVDGWVFYIEYSREGDCIWITEHELDKSKPCKNPCSLCGKEWDHTKHDECQYCGNEVPF
jgi:hypothetical protein